MWGILQQQKIHSSKLMSSIFLSLDLDNIYLIKKNKKKREHQLHLSTHTHTTRLFLQSAVDNTNISAVSCTCHVKIPITLLEWSVLGSASNCLVYLMMLRLISLFPSTTNVATTNTIITVSTTNMTTSESLTVPYLLLI